MAHNPPLFPCVRARGEEGPSASASGPRRRPATRLIGAFTGLCQFGKKWSDMMRRMALSPRDCVQNGLQNRLQNLGESALPPCHFKLRWGSQRCV